MLAKIAVAVLACIIAGVAIVHFGQRALIYPAPREVLVTPPPGYRFVETRTSDGLLLRAAYRSALGGKSTLLFFHGNGDSLIGAAAATALVVEQGYGAMLVEYRGYGGNPGSPTEEGLYKDGEAAIAWLARQGVGPEKLVVIGNSIGSGPATEMALRHNPAGLILVSGFASLPAVVSDIQHLIPLGPLVRDRYDNEAKLGRIDSRILILHGDADTLIRPAHARRLADAAPEATLKMIRGAGHELAYGRPAQQPMLQWLDRHLVSQSR